MALEPEQPTDHKLDKRPVRLIAHPVIGAEVTPFTIAEIAVIRRSIDPSVQVNPEHFSRYTIS